MPAKPIFPKTILIRDPRKDDMFYLDVTKLRSESELDEWENVGIYELKRVGKYTENPSIQ